MKTRSERECELRVNAAAGGPQLAQLVGLFMDARDVTGHRDSLDMEEMIQEILSYEESIGILQPDQQSVAVAPPQANSASTASSS